jgi:hypothetical protein
MRFAHVFSNGEVDTERARGISRENVVAGEIRDPEDGVTLHRLYCFVGLPTPLGGQVSGDLDPGDFDANDEHLDLYGFENCSPLVVIDEPPDSPRITGFQVLLLY